MRTMGLPISDIEPRLGFEAIAASGDSDVASGVKRRKGIEYLEASMPLLCLCYA